MSMTPLAYADSLRIGSIDFVSPVEIKVVLDAEAPDGTALNTGTPRAFPEINGYVLVPNNAGFLVGQIEWITIERSQLPSQSFKKNSLDLIDLPYPLRKMSVMPLGTLFYKGVDGSSGFVFKRGISNFPSVGAPVLLPTRGQLKDIIESGEHRRVKIGTSPLADGAEVMIDPDRLFGRHLAVLGNTGSGKSCSVAGLIHWSLEAAKKELKDGKNPNARFVVLDPNGEYSKAFNGQGNVRVFSVELSGDIKQMQIPVWLWNTEEWSAFTQATPKTQQPLLRQALRSVRDGVFDQSVTKSYEMRRYLNVFSSLVKLEEKSGDPYKKGWGARGFKERLSIWSTGLEKEECFHKDEAQALDRLKVHIAALLNNHPNEWPEIFSRLEITSMLDFLKETHEAFGGSTTDTLPMDPDVPRPFTSDQFVKSLEGNAELMGISEYVETLIMRVRSLLSDTRMKTISCDGEDISLVSWLSDYIGTNAESDGTVTVIDLSLVPAEVVHIVTAVVSRMTLEALQRYRKSNKGKVLPTVLVMEEAHTFVKRYKDDAENQSTAAICCKVFEKIAREGRKFGLGMVLSSQRPSELSPTVLSQCNSFLLHRISNDRDQELVHRLVPDNLRGLLRDLPSLPARHAILLGWASELPTLVEMNHLSAEKRPQSDDPDFWNVWSGKEERLVDWSAIANDWQQTGNVPFTTEAATFSLGEEPDPDFCQYCSEPLQEDEKNQGMCCGCTRRLNKEFADD